MLDDFNPRPRPKPSYTPRGQQPGAGEPPKPEQLTGFRPASTLPVHAGDDLMTSNAPMSPEPTFSSPVGESNPKTTLAYAPAGPLEPEETQHNPEEMPLAPKKKRSKKKIALIVSIILVVLGGGGFAGWYFGIRDTGTPAPVISSSNSEVKEETQAEPVSNLVAAPITGVDVEPAVAARPVTAIMIENSGEARPQSGLQDADLVFEAIAEGGITRFLALFQSKQPQYIGPIRSARPYYVEWAATFDATYIHAGGSPDGLQRIAELQIKDLSAFSDSDVFYRTTDRFAPHNLYSSFKGIDELNTQKGFTKSTFTSWSHKPDVPQSVTAKSIDIAISSSFYNPHYDYDASTNSYLRSEGGEAHKDEKTGKQLAPYVVLVLEMPHTQNGIYSVYNTTGTGKFIAFQDGIASEGTWSRSGAKDQYVFKDKYGLDFKFTTGQTWVSLVSSISDVTYTP